MKNEEMKNADKDTMELIFTSKSENENFARVVAAAFCARLDPTVEEISDIKTAVSEAVTNCVVHGYENTIGQIYMKCSIDGDEVTIQIHDDGVGIGDITQAMELTFMEAFMDELRVDSKKGRGTTIIMKKRIGVRD